MSTSSQEYRSLALDDDGPLPAASSLHRVLRLQRGTFAEADDEVIEEVPVALVYNGISHAVMLASPCDLEDFAVGFSLSEGIVAQRREIYDLELKNTCDGIAIEMDIAPARFAALKERRRNLAGRTGCGLCGVDSLANLTRMPAAPLATPAWQLSPAAIAEGLRQLPHWQALREQTGAAHGAAWADLDGNIQFLREDVGRHNALDKLVGALARQTTATASGFALVTSRASYEMVQKAATAGISALVAVSAPTGLAIRQAEAAGILLVGFARAQQLVAYSGIDRLAQSDLAPAGPRSLM
ncbi:MAG: formate dehydrogenase accessory sulfurtransferase FdhD [Rhodocyclales bacterium GT-UBC]|nr:MAG: formate dehydrogenase accessory sulfurtransferase FdhD [Rhodocyclales bacterium GT-UBC]